MKRTLLFVGALLLSIGTSFGQITDLGGPIGWKGKLSSTTNLPTEHMAHFDMEAVRAEDEINDETKAAPWRFGKKFETNYTLENNGQWEELPNGNRIWRMGIVSDGAMTMNLLFENLHIPNGAHLYLYDINQTNRVGAYTSRNNHYTGELGTELVHGDHIIVEYYEPASVKNQGTFTISNVIHGYRSLNIIQDQLAKGINDSGNCNVDVNCPSVSSFWDDAIRSVAMIVVGGNGICSGALINNTCNDGTTYFLTANHCLGGSTGNWAFRFNWEVPEGDPSISCQSTTQTNPSSLSFDQSANGATILASGTEADHALLSIDNMTVTDAQNWGCYYAGWNRDDTQGASNVSSATGIHHPSGDVKKICFENDVPTQQNAAGAACWWINDWDLGVTEPGSSGSPLFDQNGRIIGQLYGGAAACNGTNDNNQYDYYGRLGISWDLGIGNYLAPASCGDAISIDGWDPNQPTAPDDAGIQAVTSPSGPICGDNFDAEVVLRNFGSNDLTSVTINYDIDGGASNTFNWTGTLAPGGTTTVSLGNMSSGAGSFTFNASTSSPNGTTDSDASNDASSSSYSVTIGGQPAVLTLNTDCWGYETYWEVVDATSSVVASGGNTTGIPPGGGQAAAGGDAGAYGNETTITENLCLASGCYDFIIYDDWGDGLAGTNCDEGNYVITDGDGTTLASMSDAAFGNSDTLNFCLSSPCNATFDSSTSPELCFGDNTGSITINFLTGNSSGATYDIGSGSQTNNTFNGMSQGNYTVTVVDGDACTSVVSVTLGGPSQLSATNSITNEVNGNDGAITVTATGGTPNYTYAWTGPNGFTSTDQNISGLDEGMYSVTITDDNGCTTTLSNLEVEGEVGINELDDQGFVVYPNPTNGIVHIEMSASWNDVLTVNVTDVTGRIVYSNNEQSQAFMIDLSHVTEGTYLLNVTTKNHRSTQPIVVKR